MQHHFADILWCIFLKSLTPVVANRICEHRTLPIKRGRGDGSSDCWVALQSVLGIAIPEMKRAVTTSSGKGTMDGVERDCIDTVDIGHISIGASRGRCVTVALEAEVVGRVLFFDILNSASPFDTTDSEARCVGKGRHYSGLIFQGGLHRLVELFGRVQVYNVDVPISSTDDQEFVFDIHCVNPFLTLQCGNWILLS